MQILFYILVLIVFLTMVTLLVAAHEYGHYLFARIFKMDVEEFSIGFGKKPIAIIGEKNGTKFTVRPWPLGGFVKIAGMQPEPDGSEVYVQNGFYSKPPWQRLLVLFAGPLFSLLAGFVVLIPLFTLSGSTKYSKEPVFGDFGTGAQSIAQKAGVQAGDRVVSIDGQPVSTFYDIIKTVEVSANKQLTFVLDRKGKRVEAEITPEVKEGLNYRLGPDMEPLPEMGENLGRIGVSPERVHVKMTFGEATREVLLMPVKMVQGLIGIVKKPASFEHQVGGPATMVAATSATLQQGFDEVIRLGGLLSLSLAIFNLLPVHPLDGGQMVVALAEMLRRGRRLSFQVQNTIGAVGFSLVLLLIVSVLFVDFRRWTGLQDEKPPAKKKAAPSTEPAPSTPSGK